MEIEENHRNHKRSRVGNGNQAAAKLDDDEDDGDQNKELSISNNNSSSSNRMRPWHHPSSRIFRVSRASGGKDRHSKVYTAKGLRDRRVRLSVSTAIQFYDLQDRLGYDQPSKAIEWLIKAAESAIAELPSLDTTFPDPPLELQQQQKQLAIEKVMPSDSGIDPEADPSYNQQQHSSASETSKGSVLSLSRSESRVKARERARERVKEKDRDEAQVVSHHQTLDPSLNSQGSFTKLLTGGSSSSTAVTASSTADFIHNQLHNLPPVTSTTDYFGIQSSLLGQQQQRQQKSTHLISSAGFSSQAHFGNSSPIGMIPLFTNAGDHPTTETQQFAFDHFFPVATATASTGGGGGDYSLNFSISPSLAGFHRGTLQSNSTPHHHHHHHQLQLSHHHQVQAQRFSSALDGSSVPFFFGAPATTTTAGSHTENPYSSASGFDGYKHLQLNGKGKN